MKPQLILLGAPGSGKGTQASLLISEYGYNHLSTGDLLRAEVAKKSELGKKISGIMNAGKLVDDDTVLELLRINCDLDKSNYIFDGFPRNLEQAKALDEVVIKDAKVKALYFDLELDVIVERLVNRRNCQDCNKIYNLITNPPKLSDVCDSCGGSVVQRKDDTEEVVKNRLEVFKTTIDPVLDYYQKKGILSKLDASGEADKVAQEICKIIDTNK